MNSCPIFKRWRKVLTLSSNDESDNSGDLNSEDEDLEFYEQLILNQEFGLCPKCNQSNTHYNWCKECYSKKFQQNFCNWTSGNEHIDKFIQESQLNARNKAELLEWIPYNRLRNIQFLAKGGFSTIYKALWLDGLIDKLDYEKQDWIRDDVELCEQDYKDAINPKIKNPLESNEKYGEPVVLKSLNDSSNINENFLNEWKLHLKCQNKVKSNGATLVPLLGMTQDPNTLNYMVVMEKVPLGSLRDNLLIAKYNPNDKFGILWYISTQLEAIHKLNLIHGDFHNGNLLYCNNAFVCISDLGLCRSVNQSNTTNDIYGVLPYIAPEVLCGKPYTKAADIYSFGIIMWEMTSGVPAFHNIPHDFYLSLSICKGTRPEIVEGTMPEYVELMKRCWDKDPEKRPTANELKRLFLKWKNEYLVEKDEEKRVPIPENKPEIVYHPKSYYSSRKVDYSVKINEMLISESLADCIITEEEAEFIDCENDD